MEQKKSFKFVFFPLFSRKVLLYFILIGQVLTVIFLSIFLGNFMVSNASFCVLLSNIHLRLEVSNNTTCNGEN